MYNFNELNSQILVGKELNLEKDKEALKEYLRYIEDNSEKFSNFIERATSLIERKIYDGKLLNINSKLLGELLSIYDSYNYEFQSFMSAFKFYNDYSVKSPEEKYLEGFKDRCMCVCLTLNPSPKFLVDLLTGRVQPATPVFLNAGKVNRGEFTSCYLLETEDSLKSITDNISTSMNMSKLGGGVAINLSNLRPLGDNIKNIPKVSKGVVPIAKIYEVSFNYADQMGQRKGAGAVYLNIFHRDIVNFLDTKKINSDEKSRLQTLSTGVIIPDLFIELVREGKDIVTFSPYELRKYGYIKEHFYMDKELYEKLLKDNRLTTESHSSRQILLSIAKLQFESGYPYLFFIDNANKVHANNGTITMTNLCTEIMQSQYRDDKLNSVTCILGSLNVNNIMKDINSMYDTVYELTKSLSNIATNMNIFELPEQAWESKHSRSIGIGSMNLYRYCVENNLSYGSPEMIDFCDKFFMLLNYYSLKASNEICKNKVYTEFYFKEGDRDESEELGINNIVISDSYKGFEESKYYSGEYFDWYLPQIEHLQPDERFKWLPTKDDWEYLKSSIQKYGLYNSYRLTIAPTQGISYLSNSTPSIYPPMDLVESRSYGNSTTYYPAPGLTIDNKLFYRTTYEISQEDMIKVVSAIQKHIDQGISTTLYATAETSTKDLMKLYLKSHELGLKSLYYTRVRNKTVNDCLSCQL